MVYSLESLIFSVTKRKQIEDILYDPHPSHNRRIYLVGFLNKVARLKSDDIIDIIHGTNKWLDYTQEETTLNVKHICNDKYIKSYTCTSTTGTNTVCSDSSIFGTLNRAFFSGAKQVAYEYDQNLYKWNGKIRWEPTRYPIYRTIQGIKYNLFVIDLDCKDLHLCWEIAKRIHAMDEWSYFKYSGNKGFHLIKISLNSIDSMRQYAEKIYNQISSNLVSFEDPCNKSKMKLVNIDPGMYRNNKLIRGYCINLSSYRYSIPVSKEMDIGEIIEISSDISKINEYIKQR